MSGDGGVMMFMEDSEAERFRHNQAGPFVPEQTVSHQITRYASVLGSRYNGARLQEANDGGQSGVYGEFSADVLDEVSWDLGVVYGVDLDPSISIMSAAAEGISDVVFCPGNPLQFEVLVQEEV